VPFRGPVGTGGKAVLLLQLRHETHRDSERPAVGFDLVGGIRLGQATQLADLLNKYVLNMFVIVTENRAIA
jgi:hypothetical protein